MSPKSRIAHKSQSLNLLLFCLRYSLHFSDEEVNSREVKWFVCTPAQCGVQDSDTLTCFGLLFDHEDVIGFWETVVEPLFSGRHKETMENCSKNPPKSSLGNQWASWDYWQSRVRGHFQQQNHWNFSPIRSLSCVGEVALSTYLPHIYIVETYKNIELIQRVGRCKRRDWELQWGSWNLCVYWILLWRSIVSQEAWGGPFFTSSHSGSDENNEMTVSHAGGRIL